MKYLILLLALAACNKKIEAPRDVASEATREINSMKMIKLDYQKQGKWDSALIYQGKIEGMKQALAIMDLQEK
jgi:hypothetical protein